MHECKGVLYDDSDCARPCLEEAISTMEWTGWVNVLWFLLLLSRNLGRQSVTRAAPCLILLLTREFSEQVFRIGL